MELLTPPHLATLTGNMKLMEHLLEQGFTLDNKLNAWEITPLELAVSTNQANKVTRLLEAMFHACYLDIPHYSLDCERKNKQGLYFSEASLWIASLTLATTSFTIKKLVHRKPREKSSFYLGRELFAAEPFDRNVLLMIHKRMIF